MYPVVTVVLLLLVLPGSAGLCVMMPLSYLSIRVANIQESMFKAWLCISVLVVPGLPFVSAFH